MPRTAAPHRPKPYRPIERTPPVGRATAMLYRHGVWLFAGFSAAVLVAFWPSYFSRLTAQPTFYAHAHGMSMVLWCLFITAQAWLIRTHRRAVHRQVGVLSYLLVPAIVVTTVGFVHMRVAGGAPLGIGGAYFLALVLNALAAFLVIYGLAMAFRRQSATHARYMLCTIFPFVTPVTDRLIGAHAPGLIAYVLQIDGITMLPVAGFVLADAALVGLAIWDWRTSRRLDVFPIALGVLVAYHASVMTFHRWPVWHAFGAWFAALPLS